MAEFNAINYAKAYVTKPFTKVTKGEISGEVKILKDSIILIESATTALDATDTILVGYIPEGSQIVDAKMFINKTVGATGIFSLGLAEFTDADGSTVSADPNGLIAAADAGGQAVLERATLDSVLLYQHIGSGGALVYATCTEVMDDSVLDAVLHIEVNYVNA